MITEVEIAEKLTDYVDQCAKDALLDLYNHVYGEANLTIDDVKWGE
ncbi:unnamed protein product [marine sediment metagenome]|uniref:Uncharacterized protein n=1 Tax=marine sediment metagenome TaxID=412755 RepID=X1CKT9_9ZZZZ